MPTVLGQYCKADVRFSVVGFPDAHMISGYAMPTGATFNTGAGAINAAIVDAYNNNLVTLVSDQVVLETITITDFRTATGAQYVSTPGETGSAAGNMLPPGVALCATLITDIRGRSYRGRQFHLGFTEADNGADGRPSNALQLAAQAYWDDIRTDLSAGTFDLSVVSLYSGVDVDGRPIPRATAVVTPVTQVFVDNQWDRQKRRGITV